MPEHETLAGFSSTVGAVIHSRRVRLCRWLLRVLSFVWGTLIVGIIIGTIANLNTTATDTPLSKLYLIHVAIAYPLATTASIGILVLLTILSWIGSQKRPATTPYSGPLPEISEEEEEEEELPRRKPPRPPSKLFPATHPKDFTLLHTIQKYPNVISLCISPREKVLVTLDEESKIYVWDMTTGKLLNSFTIEGSNISISPDGQTLVANGNLNEEFVILIYNLRTGELLDSFPSSFYQSLTLSPDGHTLVTVEIIKNQINVWDLRIRNILFTLPGHGDDFFVFPSIAISPDGHTLFSGGTDSPTINVWNLQTREMFEPLQALSGVRSLVTSLNGQVLVSSGIEEDIGRSYLQVWDPYTEETLVNTIKGQPMIIFTAPAISPDGQILVCGDTKGNIKMWNSRTGELLNTLQGHKGSLRYVAISPDGQMLVSSGEDHTIRIWGKK